MRIYKGTVLFETDLSVNGYSYLTIYGRHINGGFCCIPNWNIGCERSEPNDTFYNTEKLVGAGLSEETANAIAKGIYETYKAYQKAKAEREEKIAREEHPKEFETPFTETLLDDMEQPQKHWLKIKVSHNACIARFEKHSFMRMPSNSVFAGFTYNVFNNRIKESRQLVDLESDGHELCYELIMEEREEIELKNGNNIIRLSAVELSQYINGTSNADYYSLDEPAFTVAEEVEAEKRAIDEMTEKQMARIEQEEKEEKSSIKKNKENTEMNNQVKLQGKLEDVVKIQKGASGKEYVRFSLLVTHKTKTDEVKTDTYDLVAFGKSAETVTKCKAGDTLSVTGRLMQKTDENGKSTLSVCANNVVNAENDQSVNAVTLTGFVNNKELKLKKSANGTEYVTLALSIKPDYTEEKQFETYFVSSFGGTAKRMVETFSQRDLVSVTGALQTNEDGQLSVVAYRSEMVRSYASVQGTKKEQAQEQSQASDNAK